MQVSQITLTQPEHLATELETLTALAPHLLLVFGNADGLHRLAQPLAQRFPAAIRVGCTTAGDICGQGVSEGHCVVTALHFAHTTLVESSTQLVDMADSHAAGQRLAQQLPAPGLRAVLILGQGVAINGSALLNGMAQVLGDALPIFGGLAGDNAAFEKTWVLNHTGVHHDQLVCVGLYGEALEFSHGSFGGWAPFGPARKVTRCQHNVLFELDGEPALDVYQRYLGGHAKDLPASGLLFPFAMLGNDHNEVGLIRTILGVDEAAGSLILAGDIDAAAYLRLMHASTDDLVEGAEMAAKMTQNTPPSASAGLALLVSCVGRKLVMGGRVDEEVEAVGGVLGPNTVLAGFYSNGEIGPLSGHTACKLHNQTMTITYLRER